MGNGVDTVQATLGGALAGITVTGAELLTVRATAAAAIDMGLSLDGVYGVTNVSSSGAVTLNNWDDVTSVSINGATADTNLGTSAVADQSVTVNLTGVLDASDADVDVDAANNDVSAMTLNSLTASSLADLRIDEVETLTIAATGSLELEDISEGVLIETINISGEGAVTFGDLTDASALVTLTSTGSGAVNAEIDAATDLAITTGSGNDRIGITDANWDSDDSINLGDGTDTLAIGVDNGDTVTLTSALVGTYSGVEVVELATQAGGAGADTVTMDTAELANNLTVGVFGDGSDAADDVYAFDSVTSGVTVTIDATVATIDVDLEDATGTADIINLNLGGSADMKIDTKADIDGFETVNIVADSDATADGLITIDDVDAADATSINISGTAEGVIFTDISDVVAGTTVLDATSLNGDLTLAGQGEALKKVLGATGTNDITLIAGGLTAGRTFTAQAATDDVLTVTATQDQNMGIISVSGFETLELTTENGNADDLTVDFRNAQDIGVIKLSSGDNTDDLVFDRLAESTVLNIDDTFVNVTLTQQTGTSTSISASAGATSRVDGTLTLDGAVTTLNVDTSDAAMTLDALAGAALTTVVATGDNAFTLTATASTTTLVDASAMTAGTVTVTAASGGTVIKAGAGASVLTGGAGVDTFYANSGVDKIVIGDVTDGDIDTIDGFAGGTDEIYATSSTTADNTAVTALNELGTLSTDTYANLAAVLTALGAGGGLQTTATEASLFTYDGDRYLLVDGANNGYAAADDTLVILTGVTGTIVAADIIYT